MTKGVCCMKTKWWIVWHRCVVCSCCFCPLLELCGLMNYLMKTWHIDIKTYNNKLLVKSLWKVSIQTHTKCAHEHTNCSSLNVLYIPNLFLTVLPELPFDCDITLMPLGYWVGHPDPFTRTPTIVAAFPLYLIKLCLDFGQEFKQLPAAPPNHSVCWLSKLHSTICCHLCMHH